MAAIFLERVNSVPLGDDKLSPSLEQWFSNTVDTVNHSFTQVDDAFNNLAAPSYTTVEIAALLSAAPNGSLYYDVTLNQLQAKVNGVLVVLA